MGLLLVKGAGVKSLRKEVLYPIVQAQTGYP